ncbi:CsbD family protein [Sphingomonas sp. S-NIH.Pt15_0812]|jgi:uncharacterized protein YjbJ (UPF0337 family)|uniref:CsbD family protein n=1 Tax=Sphingomonas sp. S-NIH.Pt15_0812 TaxID=1920129 RepID=UPI000F7F21C3|nr:CsbD family protein [Sphingomonas sp. S-NIH.Pt15_0812]RSU47726.1 CsbD family protein [Sphingomonas sp. S-NIH.Pt15_0812]
MTKRRTSNGQPSGDVKAASVREAKASVHEAIGKLIGDDAAEAQGIAEKHAARSERKNSRSPR